MENTMMDMRFSPQVTTNRNSGRLGHFLAEIFATNKKKKLEMRRGMLAWFGILK